MSGFGSDLLTKGKNGNAISMDVKMTGASQGKLIREELINFMEVLDEHREYEFEVTIKTKV